MITVKLLKDGQNFVEQFTAGVYVDTISEGWLHILDENFLTLAVYPKDIVVSANLKAGETTMTGADTDKT